jgi:hypothetical protein
MQAKPALFILLLLMILVILTGCGKAGIGSPPSDEGAITGVINGYYSAYNSQSFNNCLNYLSSSVIKKYGESSIVQITSNRYVFSGNADYQIRKITVTGNTATVSIYEKFSKTVMATSADIVDGTLIKENGQWKLNWRIPGSQ